MTIVSLSQSEIDGLFNRIDNNFPNFDYHFKSVDINLCWKDDSSLLMTAARKGLVTTVHNFIELGADVNASSNTGNTALMEAARNNHIRVIKLLIQNGADIEARDQNGLTAWQLAAGLNHKEAAAAMLDQNEPEVVAIALNKVADSQYKKQQYCAVLCVLLAMVLACGCLFMPTTTVIQPSQSPHTTMNTSTTTSVVDNITTTLPTNSTATPKSIVTWLDKHLTAQGMSADLIALCEDKLVRQEGFGNAHTLTVTPTAQFNQAYLQRLGITGLGVQHVLLQLHRECVEDEYYVDFSTKGDMFWDTTTTIEDAYYSDVMYSTSATTEPTTSTNATDNSPTTTNTANTSNTCTTDEATTTTSPTNATTNSTTATTNTTTATSPSTTITWTLPDNTTITVTTPTPHTPKSEEELENKVYGIIFCMIMFVVIICCTRTVK